MGKKATLAEEELKRQATEAAKTLQLLRILDQKPRKTEEDYEDA